MFPALTLQKPRQWPLAMQGLQGFRQPAQQVPQEQVPQELLLPELVLLGQQAFGLADGVVQHLVEVEQVAHRLGQ